MIKLKKVIPIFMFIFSIFLIGNSKIYALTSKTLNYDDVYLNDYFNKLSEKNEYDYNSLNQYYKQAIDFVNSGEYLQYGKYYAIVFTSNETAEVYMSNDEKMFKFRYCENNYFWFAFVSTNSKLYENNYKRSGNSKYEFAVNQISGSFLSNINLEKNTFPKYNPIIITNLNKIYQSSEYSNTTNQTTYNPGDVVFNIDNGNISLNSNFVKKEPQLNYKNSFISNEDYDKLGKVSIEFNENDETISKYNYAQFKLQYGSNDFKQENIPIFSHYKVFGKSNANTNWEEVDPKSISYNDEQMNLQVIDTSYDYVEGSLADSTVTVQMDFMKSLNSLYEIWKIEFYFDNTQNGYFYVADTLKNSNWTDTSKFLENYIYYEFPNDKMYAFISSENENNSGKIYFPTNSIENEDVKINFKYFDRKSNTYDSPLPTKIYDNDDYYSYIDFKFNNKEKILSVNRNKGSHVVKTYGTDILNFYKSWFGLNKKIIPNEITYFYVPIGFNVYFSNGKDITQVKTSEGYVDIDNSTTTDYFNSSNVSDSISDLLKNISLEKNNKLISLINELYNKFRQSQIGGYVYMIIITSIIILVIKAIKR